MTRKEWTIIGALGMVVVVVFAILGCLILATLTTPPRQADQFATTQTVISNPIPKPTQTPQLKSLLRQIHRENYLTLNCATPTKQPI